MVATKKSVTVNTFLNVLLSNVQTDCEEMKEREVRLSELTGKRP